MDARDSLIPSVSPEEEILRLIRDHGLSPHPEGGFYREVHRSAEEVETVEGDRRRGAVSVILFLIPGGIETQWHRVYSCEIWHYLAGDPIFLEIGRENGPETRIISGDPARALAVVPPGAWQRARSGGSFSLASCTVAPAFDFKDFILWEGPGSSPFAEFPKWT